jgi:hypothetical protein
MQTYQELSKEVEKELKDINVKDPQNYFWELKKIDPKRFERMDFDTNGHKPYSITLSEILMDLHIAGIWKRLYES